MSKSISLIALSVIVVVALFQLHRYSEKQEQAALKKEKLHKTNNNGGEEEEDEGHQDKQVMLDDMFKQWEEMLKDPATGKIPKDRLFAAWQYTKALQDKEKALAGFTTSGSSPVWINRGPTNVGGRTRTIMISPKDATGNTCFAGSVGGGLWKSTNLRSGNPTWKAVNDFLATLAISSIAYDPSNTSIFYAGTGEGFSNSDAATGMGIFKSADAGTTWSLLTSTMTTDFRFVNKMVVTSSGTAYAATSTGIFRSKDKGTTWEKVLSGNFGDIEVSGSGTFYVSGISHNQALYKSASGDAGTWVNLCTQNIGLPSVGIDRVETAVAPNNANKVYTVFFMDTTVSGSAKKKTVIYSSSDNGASFVRVGRPVDADNSNIPSYDYTATQGFYDLILKVDPNNANVVYTGGIDLFKSTNGGSTWTQISHWYGGFNKQQVHADQHGIEFEGSNSNVIYFTNDGGIAQTTNGNNTVPTINTINTNYIVTQFYACAGNPAVLSNYFLAGAQDNGTQAFSLPGLGETQLASGGDGGFCHIDELDTTYQYTQYVYNNYYRSSNGGEDFQDAVNVPISIKSTGRFINPTDYDAASKSMFAGGNSGQYVRWVNANTSSTFQNVSVTGMAGQISAVTVSSVIPGTVYFGTGFGQVLAVANAATVATPATPKSLGTPTSAYVNCIWEDSANADHLIVVYTNYGIKNIWETSNASAATPTWTSKDGNLPDMPVYWVLPNPANNKQVLLATELGVYATDNFDNASPTWQPAVDGMANVRVTQIRLRESDRLVFASTHGRGLFTTDYFQQPMALFTANSKVSYTGKSISFIDQSIKATSWKWDLNADGNFDSDQKNPSFTYSKAGVYNVKLRINNDPTKEKTVAVTILPDRGTPYAPANGGDFESNPNDFAADHSGASAFYRANSTQNGKSGTHSGSFAWVIDPDRAKYTSNSTAWLYTPSFNCTAAGNYTFSFYAEYSVENDYDGFRVEYSTDKGSTWKPLGNTVQDNWYDFKAPDADRPFPQGNAYFTANNETSYTLKTFTTNEVQGNASVAFRITFKADPYVTDAGLAIDDISLSGPTNVVLPVSLIQFTGNNAGNTNLLNWKTGSEINNQLYEVQRSFDGTSFEPIGSRRSANNSNGSAYLYTDDISHIYVSNFYYRLRIVDKDNTYSYSPVVSIHVRGRTEKITILGNISSTYINIITPQALLVKPLLAEVYSMNGALIRRTAINTTSSVMYVNQYAPGQYTVRFVQDGKTIQTAAFVKQ